MKKYIEKNKLINNALYIINARNAIIGVWNSKTESFIVNVCTFNEVYLSEEDYYDKESGTAQPIKLIKIIDNKNITSENLLRYSNLHEKEYEKLFKKLKLEEM